MDGHTILMAHACAAAHFQIVNLKSFITLKTTHPCLVGLRAWKQSFRSVVCGLRKTQIFLPSAWVFIVYLAVLTAVAGVYFFAAWFHLSKVLALRADQISWTYIWFLPQISLQTQFYWIVLGCSKAPFSCGKACSNNKWDGKKSH